MSTAEEAVDFVNNATTKEVATNTVHNSPQTEETPPVDPIAMAPTTVIPNLSVKKPMVKLQVSLPQGSSVKTIKNIRKRRKNINS